MIIREKIPVKEHYIFADQKKVYWFGQTFILSYLHRCFWEPIMQHFDNMEGKFDVQQFQ